MVKTDSTGRTFPGWDKIPEDLIPATTETYDLGSSTKKWAYLYAVIAVLTSITLGGIYLGATTEGYFLINATTQINGSLNVNDNITFQYLNGTGGYFSGDVNISGDLTAGNTTLESLNVSGNISVISGNIYVDGEEVATITDLTAGNVTVSSLINVKNTAGATANKGAAMTFKSYNAAIDRYDVIFANNTARHGHAHCVMFSTVANNGQGQCLIEGALETFDTSGWAEGDDLFLNVTPGTLTATKPTSAECIQKLALVLRSHSTQGSIYIHGAGRCNDVPYNFSVTGNITASYFFGDGSLLSNLPSGDNSSWNKTYADTLYYSITNPFIFWNSTWAGFNKTYADTLYYGISNPFSFWNDTYSTFYKTYADTLYSGITEPLWAGNETNVAFKNEANVFTANQNLTTKNISAINCVIFDSGGKICSGV